MKKVLITGASKGIGKEIAKAFLLKGYEVYGTSREPDKIQDKINGINYIQLELADELSIKNCFEAVKNVDILINNAGQSQLGSVESIGMDKFERLFKINLFGMIKLTKLFLPNMRKNKSGIIVNIGSLGGRFALPYFSSYSSSKYAVQGYTQSLRYELAQFGIKVILIEPNDIKTSITPEFFSKPQSEYSVIENKVRETLWEAMSKADHPSIVAKKILAVMRKKNPKPIYAVGGNAAMLVFIKRFLPDKLIEYFIKKKYNI